VKAYRAQLVQAGNAAMGLDLFDEVEHVYS
jgi:hypothetical protein